MCVDMRYENCHLINRSREMYIQAHILCSVCRELHPEFLKVGGTSSVCKILTTPTNSIEPRP